MTERQYGSIAYNAVRRIGRIGAVAGAVCALASSALGEPLTLDDSVRIALEKNPQVVIAAEDVRRAAADVDAATAVGRPKVDISASHTTLNAGSTATLGEETIVIAAKDSTSASATASQSVDVSGTIGLGRRAASLGRAAVAYDYERVRNDTTLSAKQAFFDVLRAREQLRVSRETVAQLEAHKRDADLNYAAGTVARYDVLRAATELANARVNVVAAGNAVGLAEAAFNSVLGRDTATPVELADPGNPQFVDLRLEDCIAAASEFRPELKASDARINRSDVAVAVAERGKRPTLDASLTVNRNYTLTLMNNRKTSWAATLYSKTPLYDGGRTSANTESARSDAEIARYSRESTALGVTLDVKQAFLDMQEAREAIGAAGEGLALAREGARVAEVSYRNGVTTQKDLLDAQAALVSAEGYSINATYNYHSAVARLEQAVGGRARLAALAEGAKPSQTP